MSGSWAALARAVIEAAVRGEPPPTPPQSPPEPYGGVFVTLRRGGRLRGCMGTLDSEQPLAKAVCYAAERAAQADPRFPPLSEEELPQVRVEVSVMTPPRPMRDLDDLELGRHGVLVRRGLRQGLFLPQVATEHRLDKQEFLARCCTEKAGLWDEAWRDPETTVLIFETRVDAE